MQRDPEESKLLEKKTWHPIWPRNGQHTNTWEEIVAKQSAEKVAALHPEEAAPVSSCLLPCQVLRLSACSTVIELMLMFLSSSLLWRPTMHHLQKRRRLVPVHLYGYYKNGLAMARRGVCCCHGIMDEIIGRMQERDSGSNEERGNSIAHHT